MIDRGKLECEIANMSSHDLTALVRESGMFDQKETPELMEKMMRQTLAAIELHNRKKATLRKVI